MIQRIKNNMNTFSLPIWAGFDINQIEDELYRLGASIVVIDIECRYLLCNGKIYDPYNLDDRKRAIDDLGLCPFRSPVKTDLAKALYQTIQRWDGNLPCICLTTPRTIDFRGQDARTCMKEWAHTQIA